MSESDEQFEGYRPLLFSIAYRMLGSVMEAEDIVQETFLRYEKADTHDISSTKAYLTTITTRLCLDQLKSARAQREEYIGPWLPEPLVTEQSPAAIFGQKESVSMAFLVLLEKLSPVERAVFLLREVFDYSYSEIAQIVKKSEANCRQLFSRAKRYLVEKRPRFQPSLEKQRQLINTFLQATISGDVERLTQVLAEDVVHYSDGGGKVFAAKHPIIGRAAVIRLFKGLPRLAPEDVEFELVEVNGNPSVIFRSAGKTFSVLNFAFHEERIVETRVVLNPDKLQHLHQ